MTIYSIPKQFRRNFRSCLAFCGLAALGAGMPLAGAADLDLPEGFTIPASWAQESTAPQLKPAAKASETNAPHDQQSFRVVNPGGVRTAADMDASRVMRAAGLADNSILAQSLSVAPVAYNEGCSTCGTTNCNGDCGGSVSGIGIGNFNPGYGTDDYQPRFGSGTPTACGTPCNPYRYAMLEGLYMRRSGDDNVTFSPTFGLSGFTYEWAPRVTVGAVPDCNHGYEFSFVGPFNWDQGRTVAARLDHGSRPSWSMV